eukprot:scaffold7939_cov189-Ochromonas_danica.AAC.3
MKLTRDQKEGILDDLTQAVDLLHRLGFVHGDLREPNILLTNTEHGIHVWLIDFDFAGPIGEARYPMDLDLDNFPWLEESDLGNLITVDHDMAALKYYAKDVLCL